MALTDTQIKQAKPKEKAYKLYDGGGLYLLIKPMGGKYWRLKYQYHGKEKSCSYGTYPSVSLKEARAQRDTDKKLLREGGDPSLEKKKQKLERQSEGTNTFSVIAREWHDKESEGWSEKHADRVIKSLERDVFPWVGDIPIKQINTADLLDVLKKVEQRDALDLAGRLRQRCEQVFRYAIQTRRTDINPVAELQGALKTRKATHRAAMDESDLPEFLTKLNNYDGYVLTKYALQLLVHTFVRPGEVRFAAWNEFDFDKKWWKIPADRMKMKSPHIIPLSDQVISLLETIKPYSRGGELLFPGERSKQKPISENTMTYALYRLGYKGRATVHGFRGTASTILNESGLFNTDSIERQLSHQERNSVRAAYNHADYLSERAEMMQWWSDFLDKKS